MRLSRISRSGQKLIHAKIDPAGPFLAPKSDPQLPKIIRVQEHEDSSIPYRAIYSTNFNVSLAVTCRIAGVSVFNCSSRFLFSIAAASLRNTIVNLLPHFQVDTTGVFGPRTTEFLKDLHGPSVEAGTLYLSW